MRDDVDAAAERVAGDDDDHHDRACYICAEEEGALPLDCACRTLRAHPACLVRMAQGRADNRCPVCRQPMPRVRVERRYTWSARGPGLGLGLIEVAAHACLAISVMRLFWFLFLHPPGMLYHPLWSSVVLMSCVTSVAMTVVLVCGIRIYTLLRRMRPLTTRAYWLPPPSRDDAPGSARASVEMRV